MTRGRYIAFEGIEGAGKTTLAAALAELLRADGRAVVEVREPGGTGPGEVIRDLLLFDHDHRLGPWTEALLFAAARSQLAADVIGPALAAGSWVIGDRSVYSSLAYQGGGRGLGVAEVRAVNEAGLGGVWPDLAILLDVVPEAGLARQAVADKIGGEGAEFQSRVADAFASLMAAEPDRFAVIDAARPVADVAADAYALVRHRW